MLNLILEPKNLNLATRLDVQRQVLALAAAHAVSPIPPVPLGGRLRQALHAHRLPHLPRNRAGLRVTALKGVSHT